MVHWCVGASVQVSNSTFTNNLMESSDAGVVYSESDWTFRGNQVISNRAA